MDDFLYERIADDLRKKIKMGVFSQSGILPTQKAMRNHYKCSVRTIQRAVEILKDEQIVSAQRGVGYFLSSQSS